MNSRLIKICFSGALGLYVLLVCFNNVVDYDSNFEFVKMVARMEDTFSKENNGWRSINKLFFHHLMFIIIIVWEALIAGLILFGAVAMITQFSATQEKFAHAKRFVSVGISLGVLLWFIVFIAIGGEWFLMWQSKRWNAQQTAFLLTCCFLLFLIHHNQAEG